MASGDDLYLDVPGTVYLVDGETHMGEHEPYAKPDLMNFVELRTLHDAAHDGNRDVLLIPQPSASLADPLVSDSILLGLETPSRVIANSIQELASLQKAMVFVPNLSLRMRILLWRE